MDSETTATKRSASAGTKTATVLATPRIPQEIIDEILDLLSAGGKPDSGPSLRSCCLVARSWVASCRQHLFHTISFTWRNATDWVETFPVPQDGPAHLVRELRFWSPGRRFDVPERFFDHIPWFTDVRSISWEGEAGSQPLLRILSLGRLSQSVTSLSIEMYTVSALQIRDAMALLPNLKDLKLAGSLVMIDKTRLRGIGEVLRGDFGGKLMLLKEHVHPDIVDMLLGVPTGLHFTELQIHSTKQNIHLVVRLSEACGRNLTKLTYMTYDCDGWQGSVDLFDFGSFPNLEEVNFNARFSSAGLRWIHETLLTIKRATSPRLSILRFDYYTPRFMLGLIPERLGTGYPPIKEEVSRIEREFMGKVKVTLIEFPEFEH